MGGVPECYGLERPQAGDIKGLELPSMHARLLGLLPIVLASQLHQNPCQERRASVAVERNP